MLESFACGGPAPRAPATCLPLCLHRHASPRPSPHPTLPSRMPGSHLSMPVHTAGPASAAGPGQDPVHPTISHLTRALIRLRMQSGALPACSPPHTAAARGDAGPPSGGHVTVLGRTHGPRVAWRSPGVLLGPWPPAQEGGPHEGQGNPTRASQLQEGAPRPADLPSGLAVPLGPGSRSPVSPLLQRAVGDLLAH